MEVWMTVTTYLADFDADLETKRVLEVALERTRVSLGLVDKFANGIIARRISEIAETGERNHEGSVRSRGTTAPGIPIFYVKAH
jgi:hypothetical protein